MIEATYLEHAVEAVNQVSGTATISRPPERTIRRKWRRISERHLVLADLTELTGEDSEGVSLFWRGVHQVKRWLERDGSLYCEADRNFYHKPKRIARELQAMGHRWVNFNMVIEAQRALKEQ